MDKYRSFKHLAVQEAPESFRIISVPRRSKVAVIAPHGGAIEAGTSEVARSVAGAELSLYLFEGRKAAGNRDLHITSTNFDEPQGLALVEQSEAVLAMHGEGNDKEAVVYLGGRADDLGAVLKDRLEAAGFDVRTHESPELQGLHTANICNRGTSGAGVQLELSKALRQQFFPSLTPAGRAAPRKRFYEFVRALREGLGFANPE